MHLTWEELETLRHQNIHIVGISGVEGSAIARFLLEQGFTNLTGHDFSKPKQFSKNFMMVHVGMKPQEREREMQLILNSGMTIKYQDEYLQGIEQADAIFATQAWFIYPNNHPTLDNVQQSGIPFYSMTKMYFDLAPCPIIGITGSNGKSTTSALIADILKTGDKPLYYAGNARHSEQVVHKLKTMEKDATLVLEISNRQLMGNLQRSPHIAIITNVIPNHLDEHGTFENYKKAKRELIAYQTPADFAILNYDNEVTKSWIDNCPGKALPFSRTTTLSSGAYIEDGWIIIGYEGKKYQICPLNEIRLPGTHNLENVLAASMATFLAGAAPEQIRTALSKFKGLKHRIQFVLEAGGIRFYDDLNSTTPQATIAALQSFNGDVTLIAGGEDKDLDYTELGKVIISQARRLITLPGHGTEKILQAVQAAKQARIELKLEKSLACTTLEEAVQVAYRGAKPGEVILLSPACPYFFRLYYLNDEGDETGFRAIVRKTVLSGVDPLNL